MDKFNMRVRAATNSSRCWLASFLAGAGTWGVAAHAGAQEYDSRGVAIGSELSLPLHLADGEEHEVSWQELSSHGAAVFAANWTAQEGAGRPLTRGTGTPIVDIGSPLTFPRNFNRISAPDANSCAGCHNAPALGGGGDIVANVFVLGQRFEFATFASTDTAPTRGGVDELGRPVTLDDIANSRATPGMFGSGYVELLATEMTTDLRRIRDGIVAGGSAPLVTKGVSFGELSRFHDGQWDTRETLGLSAPSLTSSGADDPPSLIIRPFHQAGAVVSLREFTNNAMNHHHGIQTTERFGDGADPDGDGFVDELTRADMTAVSVWQAALPVPGRVIPRDAAVERAVLLGERLFRKVGCNDCHRESLPLLDATFVEPNPYNPPGNLQADEAEPLYVDLQYVMGPLRLPRDRGAIRVSAYTDLKLHDITSGPDDPNAEPLNMHFAAGSAEFFAGNRHFLTKKLWGAANEPPYFHHGKFTTLREAIEAHSGEARAVTQRYLELSSGERGAIIEFLKTLQVLPAGSQALIVDAEGQPREWPPRRHR